MSEDDTKETLTPAVSAALLAASNQPICEISSGHLVTLVDYYSQIDDYGMFTEKLAAIREILNLRGIHR